MSEEEIKELAREFGLDPDLLILFEPHVANEKGYDKHARQYRFEYLLRDRPDKPYDWNFVITAEEIAQGLESVIVRRELCYGLSHLKSIGKL